MLVREGVDTGMSGIFYVTMVQSELLFGSETWVVTPCILRMMGSLHNWAAHRISGRILQQI